MSFQIAMMAGMAAMSVAQAASQASAAGKAGARATAGIHEAEAQAAIETNIKKMGGEVRAGGFQLQALQTDVTSAEVGIRTAQMELQRRAEMARLIQANAIDLVARGGVATGQDSLAAIDRGNREAAESDIKMIGESGLSQKRQLSFRKANLLLSAEGEKLSNIFTGIAGEGKQKSLEMQAADVGARAQEAGESALLAAGGKLFSLGASFSGGGGEGAKAPGSGEIA